MRGRCRHASRRRLKLPTDLGNRAPPHQAPRSGWSDHLESSTAVTIYNCLLKKHRHPKVRTAPGTVWLFPGWHSPCGLHEVEMCFVVQHRAEAAGAWCRRQPKPSLMNHQPPVGRRTWRNFRVLFLFFLNLGLVSVMKRWERICLVKQHPEKQAGSLEGESGCESRGTGRIGGLAPHYHVRARVEMMDINQIRSFPRAMLPSPKPKLWYTGVFTEQLR